MNACFEKCPKCTANFRTENKKYTENHKLSVYSTFGKGKKVSAFSNNSIVTTLMISSVTAVLTVSPFFPSSSATATKRNQTFTQSISECVKFNK